MNEDHGKCRVYECDCGGVCRRPLHGTPKPCEKCDADLTIKPHTIEDGHVFTSRLIKDARGRIKLAQQDK